MIKFQDMTRIHANTSQLLRAFNSSFELMQGALANVDSVRSLNGDDWQIVDYMQSIVGLSHRIHLNLESDFAGVPNLFSHANVRLA